MSYVRWSSVIDTDVTMVDMVKEMKEGKLKSKDMTKRQLETPGSYQSEWYIYWHASMLENVEETRSDQLLSISLAGSGKSPVVDYDEVKEMYDTDDWSALGYEEIRQKAVLRTCVKQWLDDVEEEFPE